MGNSPSPRAISDLTLHKGPAQLEIFDPAVRDDMTLRNALASRNIPQVYRPPCKMDYSQRQISRLTKQPQSEVSEIIKERQCQKMRKR
jgi:hypothetical protein